MDFCISFDTVKSGSSVVYIEGLMVMIAKTLFICSLKIDFVLINIVDSDEILKKRAKIRNQHNQAPHLTQDTNEKVTTSQ